MSIPRARARTKRSAVEETARVIAIRDYLVGESKLRADIGVFVTEEIRIFLEVADRIAARTED